MTTIDCDDCAEREAAAGEHFERAVDNSAWDGPAAMSACTNSATPASCFAAICAGKKAGDTSTQAAWALPHHKSPGSGPNAAGTANALGRLPQTSGLTNASAAKSHLQSHMKQINPDYEADAPAPVQRAMLLSRSQAPNGTARSTLFRGVIYRAKPVKKNGSEYFEVEGYASVFDKPYQMWDAFGPYDETVRSGAFDKSLADPELDVAFLVNHRGVTMARIANGTLQLWTDDHGLGARALLNGNRQDVRDIVSAIDDGLIDEMSFAFYLNAGGWNESYDKFTIFEADINRGDVSAVNYGASPHTSIAARAPEILEALAHLPAGAARAAVDQITRAFPGAVEIRQAVRQDADEDVKLLIASLDATLDEGAGYVIGLDTSSLPPDVGQALDLLVGAEAIVDQVMDLLGIDDPDDRTAKHAHIGPTRALHGAFTGTHSHPHSAYGSQGGDASHEHSHSHNGPPIHKHAHQNAQPAGSTLESFIAAIKASAARPHSGSDGAQVTSGMSVELAAALFEHDDELDDDA